MKKIIISVLFSVTISSLSMAQEKGNEKNASKKEGILHRMFNRENKPRPQMRHFEAAAKDTNMKHNGTVAWNRYKRKNKYQE